jgi:hypothetical protein
LEHAVTAITPAVTRSDEERRNVAIDTSLSTEINEKEREPGASEAVE